MRVAALAIIILLGACSSNAGDGGAGALLEGRDSVTLYRNSPLQRELRVHWATFDASDGIDYNLSNCQMAARLLNANVAASAEAEGKQSTPGIGFWCEVGGYDETGGAPIQFDSAFPTDTTGPMRFTD